jgi:exopolyphosphatase/guanosine-5'-triphosphate,3'-diphosphate pyrophosphatase
MRIAALDLGTNTFLCLLAEASDGKIQKIIFDQAETVRLGQDVNKTHRFHPDALQRADACLKKYSHDIQQAGGADVILAFATSAARDVENANELFALGERYGLPLRVISGQQEAECTFFGTVDEIKDPVAIVDVGGGSTEFIIGDSRGIQFKQSLDVGSVRLTELFVTKNPTPVAEIKKIESYLLEKLAPLKQLLQSRSDLPRPQKVIAVAGTPTILAAIDMHLPFDSEKVHLYKLPLQKIREWIPQLAQLSLEDRQKVAGMEVRRADVIVAGALTLLHSCEIFTASEIEVSTRGLRYGIVKLASSGRILT